MNYTCLVTTLIMVGLGCTPLPAQQTATYPAPKPPLVVPVPEKGQWVISVSDGTVQPTASVDANPTLRSPQLLNTQFTKTGKTILARLAYSSGPSLEIWQVDDLIISSNSNNEISVIAGSDLRNFSALNGGGVFNLAQANEFSGVGWIDLSNYKGVAPFQGQLCYHYSRAEQLQTAPAMQSQTSGTEAWISTKTGRPVAYTDNARKLYTYRFLDSPTTPLVLPAAYQAVLMTYQTEQDQKKKIDEAAAGIRRP